MTQPFRGTAGGRIDRNTPITFTFDGQSHQGFAGDTLASALLANGVHLVGRSFKYHRPRGIVSAGAEDPNGLVQVVRDSARETPNLRATQVEIYQGLEAHSQNCWPSLKWDLGAVAGLFAPLIPAGFYYKTFIGPAWFGASRTWSKIFEPMIRRAAGLGRAPREPDPDTYINRYTHCDVLVIGAGPAGLAAARSAAQAGAKVILCDEQSELGGSLLEEHSATLDTLPAQQWLSQQLTELEQAHVTLLPRTTAFGYYADNFVALAERLSDHLGQIEPGAPRERLWQVRAREVVIAAGAIERSMVFPNNDRPGVMLASAARSYLNRYGVSVGRRAVIATACDSAYAAALDLHTSGIEIAALCDLRKQPPAALVADIQACGIPFMPATAIADTHGGAHVTGVVTKNISNNTVGTTIACDVVLTSGGWTPSVHLFSQSRGRLQWNAEAMAYVPGEAAKHQTSVGACAGQFAFPNVLAEGHQAGSGAARSIGLASAVARTTAVDQSISYAGSHLGMNDAAADAKTAKAFVDLQNAGIAEVVADCASM